MNARLTLSRPAAVIILIAVTFLTYCQVLRFDFTSWDDYETIARNPKLNPPTPASLRDFWTRPQMDLYIPVTYTLWAVVANVSGAPEVFHGLSLAIHIGAAVVLFLLLSRLMDDTLAALIGACAFALHPVQVEPVAWVSGTKDVLCGLFSLIALWQYIVYARTRDLLLPIERVRTLVIATITFVLAMLSKPSAIVVPFVASVLDWMIVRRPAREVLKTVWSWFLLAVPCAIWTKLAQPAPHIADAAALWTRPLVAMDAIAFYLAKLIWPWKLAFDYGRTPQRVIQSGAIYWTWIVPALLGAALWWWRKRATALVAAGAVFVICLLPVLGLVRFDFQIYSTVADHYLYLALLGAALAVAWAVARWQRPAILFAAAVLIALGCHSFMQTRHWRDSERLFAHTLRVNPDSFASYNSLAFAKYDAGDPAGAASLARRATELKPADPQCHLMLGLALLALDNLAEARQAFETTLRFDPNDARAMSNLAIVLARQGELAPAIEYAERSVNLDPAEASAHVNLATLLAATGRAAEAEGHYRTALQLAPDNAAAQAGLASLSQSSPSRTTPASP